MTRGSSDRHPISLMTLWTIVVSGLGGPGIPRGRIAWWADPAAATLVVMCESALPPRGRVCLHTHNLSVPLTEGMGLGGQAETKGEDPEILFVRDVAAPRTPGLLKALQEGFSSGPSLLSLDSPPLGSRSHPPRGRTSLSAPVHLHSPSRGCRWWRSRPTVPSGQARCVAWAPGQAWGAPWGPSVHSPVTEPGPIWGSFWLIFTLFWGGWPSFLFTHALGGEWAVFAERAGSLRLFAS